VNGLEVCTASGDQTAPVLAPNGRGGIVVAWTDARGGQQSDVYAAVVERTAIEDFAAWPANGVAVCDAPGDQLAAATAPVGSVAVGDGTSGVFVVWQDQRPSDHGRLRVQRIGPNGAAVPGWPPDGVPLCDVASLQQGASLTFDGQGGVIAVWEDGRNPTGYDLYAQRVTGAGTLAPGWPAAGLPVCTMRGNQFEARPASDGQGGAYVVWRDARDTFSIDIYASRLTSSGSVAPGWPLNGRVFCAAVGNQHTVDIAADGRGNVFFAWIDERLRNTPRIYATFVNASGTVGVGFTTDGLRLTNTARPQKALRLLSDNDGGVVFVWLDGRRGGQDVFANRITPLLPRWGSDDVWLGRALQATTLDAAADGTGGAIVTWTSIANGVPNLMAQHVQGDGAIAAGWPNGSLRVAPSLRPQLFPNIAADGAGGAYLTWVDVRRGEADVFAQHWRGDGRLGADGGSGGVPVCIAPGTQLAPRIVTEASGCGAIAVWQDGRAGDMDIYATRLGPQRAATDIALETPAARSLAAFPNPFRARTQLAFMAPGRGALQLEVFDVAGRRVQAWNVAGLHGNQRIFWDGRDAHGTPVATGVYLVRLRGAGVDATAKLVRSR